MTRIRKAQAEDCQKIAKIMRDRSDIAFTDVDAITSRLQNSGFGENPLFVSFVAEDDDAAGDSRLICYAMVSSMYSTWEGKSVGLGDLYVVPDWRRKGVGTALLRTVMKRDRSDIAFTDADTITLRLQENGFGKDPVFICFLAEDEDTTSASRIIGYAMVSRIYSSWEGKSLRLGDLYVVQDRRRKGVGTDLLRTVMKACQEKGCKRIDCCPQQANTALISFLTKHGACNIAAEDGWCYYQLAHDDMIKLAGQE